jgi:hypothetical protein
MSKAYEIGGPAAQSSLITPIFRAYCEDDLDISDPDVLADLAEQAGIMSKDEVSCLPCVALAVPRYPYSLEKTRISNLSG